MDTQGVIEEWNRTGGIFRLKPTWVPRTNSVPGRRLKLHPRDLYAFGIHRGGITERWIASTVRANNGAATLPDEGLSYIVLGDPSLSHRVKELFLLQDAVEILQDRIVGKTIWDEFHGWPVLGKMFDNYDMIPFHLHARDIHGLKVGKIGKAEAYYFPPQYNSQTCAFPLTFFGLNPSTTKDDIKHCLERWNQGDNGILMYSKAYPLTPGTGWDVPTGILHAPGSLVTYEPQRAVDMGAMFQSLVNGRPVPWEALVQDVPSNYQFDLDYLVDLIDWKANTDPDFAATHARIPQPVQALAEMATQGYQDVWVSYNTPYFSAKELTVFPGREVTLKEEGAFGVLVTQGHGRLGPWEVETPSLVRFNDPTADEFFVTVQRAREGVTVRNDSLVENLVLLRHFAQPHSIDKQ